MWALPWNRDIRWVPKPPSVRARAPSTASQQGWGRGPTIPPSSLPPGVLTNRSFMQGAGARQELRAGGTLPPSDST